MARCARNDCQAWRPNVLVRHGRTGYRFNDAWYCAAACLEREARERLAEANRLLPGTEVPRLGAMRLGALLVHQGVITQTQLAQTLAAQRMSGLRIGQQLQLSGLASSLQVLRALAVQAGARYLSGLDLARVHHAPGDLSPALVRALGVVPFQMEHSRDSVHVACAAPLSRPALRALRELTGWTIEPFLVSDEVWPELLTAYGSSAHGSDDASVLDLDQAAARAARVAESGGSLRMLHARCASYLWVRLEGSSRHEDLLMPIPAGTEGRTWQAAHTSL